MKFKKRTYKNLKDFLSDLWFPIRHWKLLKKIAARKLISPSFRERLMLAVTAVNGCRFCSYFHTRLALKSGVTAEEIDQLLSGDQDNYPKDEAIAILYAQHWAESGGHPDPEAAARVKQVYGAEKTEAIQAVLRIIRTGNLSGNTFDYFLYRISLGKWGA